MPDKALTQLIRKHLTRPVPEAVSALAEAARSRHPAAVEAVIAYGSCLRGVDVDDTLVDLYVLVSNYRSAYGGTAEAIANRLLPPNVYYLECTFQDRSVRAKYAVVSLDQFRKKTSARTQNPYFWARFAQPSALVWCASTDVTQAITNAIEASIASLLTKAAGSNPPPQDAIALWTSALTQTYRTEWRSEDQTRALEIVDANKDFYSAAAHLMFGENLERLPDQKPANAMSHLMHRLSWLRRRVSGRGLSIARLVKAAYTFQGGAEYLAWKIQRHSGTRLELTGWQKRHPVLAGLWLLPKLYRRRIVR